VGRGLGKKFAFLTERTGGKKTWRWERTRAIAKELGGCASPNGIRRRIQRSNFFGGVPQGVPLKRGEEGNILLKA